MFDLNMNIDDRIHDGPLALGAELFAAFVWSCATFQYYHFWFALMAALFLIVPLVLGMVLAVGTFWRVQRNPVYIKFRIICSVFALVVFVALLILGWKYFPFI